MAPFSLPSRLMLGVVLPVLAGLFGTLAMLGSSAALAQTVPPQSGNIYAVADLVPAGAEADPHVAGSSATFESAESGGSRVTVVLQNVQPSTEYAVEVRDGSCSGQVLHSLQPVTSDASGAGRSVAELPASVEFGRWFVSARPAAATSGGALSGALLCGQANPALAAPPSIVPPAGPTPTTPGMPRTGQPLGPVMWALTGILGAGLLVLAGLYLRSRLIRHG
jgi:hypothetical protein